MGNVKPWQVLVMLVAVVAVGFSVYSTFVKTDVSLPNKLMAVDVETGELFQYDWDGQKPLVFPAANPDTKKRNLVPVRQRDGGDGWELVARHRDMLREVDGPVVSVDSESLAVTVSGDQPKRLR